MKTTICNYESAEIIPDLNVDPRLLPPHLRENSNSKRVEAYKIVLKMAMLNFLTPEQRQIMRMFYWQRMTKTAIGAELGITDSAACKRIKAAEAILREHMEFIDKVFDVVVNISKAEIDG